MPSEEKPNLDESQIRTRTRALDGLRRVGVDPHTMRPHVDPLIDAAEKLGQAVEEAGGARERAGEAVGEAVREAIEGDN